MDFGFAIIIDFAMNTDKLNRLMDEIVEFVNLQKIISKGQTAQILALRS